MTLLGRGDQLAQIFQTSTGVALPELAEQYDPRANERRLRVDDPTPGDFSAVASCRKPPLAVDVVDQGCQSACHLRQAVGERGWSVDMGQLLVHRPATLEGDRAGLTKGRPGPGLVTGLLDRGDRPVPAVKYLG